MNKKPNFRTREAFKIVGVERYTERGIPAIQDAWNEFAKQHTTIPYAILPGVFGIEDYSRDFDMNEGGFPKYYYIAGYAVTDLGNIPEGMTGKEIPAAKYAVFTYNGEVSRLHEFFGYIYGEWMPTSGYSMDPKLSLDFEFYSEPSMDMNNVHLEIWVPVVKE
ncbi:MAG TPA: GyrI-like domain-containing protein [Candidatus Kapabacteria bacterium]|nr:GyrI-like domain-containing protein [Candidatus Kapabacteria bacterium]